MTNRFNKKIKRPGERTADGGLAPWERILQGNPEGLRMMNELIESGGEFDSTFPELDEIAEVENRKGKGA